MPELPDVERARRVFAEHAAGRRVRRVLTTDDGVLRNVTPRSIDAALRGRRFEEPGRVGKWLLAWTDGPAIVLHFGMTGDMIPAPGARGRHRHDRVIFELDRGEVRYRNMRKLGGVWLAHDRGEVDTVLRAVGPDVLSVDAGTFVSLMDGRRGRVKAALMDQSLMSGIGNLVADEVLWHARVHPARPLSRMTGQDLASLHRTLRRVLSTWVDRPGRLPRGWLVHARGGGCPRCGAPQERSVVGGRTTFHCPRCQPT